jgi:hypothetical protein
VVRHGSLEITTDIPGARVTLDGIVAGLTPLKVASVAVGTHELRTEMAGQAPQSRSISMPEGGALVVHFSGPATLTSTPLEEHVPIQVAPARRTTGEAVKALGWAMLVGTPWLAFLVLPAIGTSILALLVWTTPAADAPFRAASDPVWITVRVVTLVAALALGAVSLGCIGLAVFFPFARLADVAEAVSASP